MISLWLNRGAEHHMTTGASSIYHATPTGFRVYIKREHCHSCSSAQQMQNAQNLRVLRTRLVRLVSFNGLRRLS